MGFAGCAKNSAKVDNGDIDKKIYNLETDFKETYQLWVDMKSMGEITNKEYVKDLKKVAADFKSTGNKAKTSSYKKLLTEEDIKIYETYRLLSDDIKDLSKFIEKKKFVEANDLYEQIIQAEDDLKE